MNKTGFQIDCRKVQLVITIDLNQSFYIIDPEIYEYIT